MMLSRGEAFVKDKGFVLIALSTFALRWEVVSNEQSTNNSLIAILVRWLTKLV